MDRSALPLLNVLQTLSFFFSLNLISRGTKGISPYVFIYNLLSQAFLWIGLEENVQKKKKSWGGWETFPGSAKNYIYVKKFATTFYYITMPDRKQPYSMCLFAGLFWIAEPAAVVLCTNPAEDLHLQTLRYVMCAGITAAAAAPQVSKETSTEMLDGNCSRSGNKKG